MYINDLLCISPQYSYDQSFFSRGIELHSGIKLFAKEPSYSELIPAGVLRRMSKIMRMGVGTGMPLLRKYNDISAIIIGTANGGIDDSMKFLSQIEEYKEGTLTPTHFVQSTPNSLSGTLSLMSQCTGYNNTHVHQRLAFENALLDAMLLLSEQEGNILAGAADEISEWNFNIEMQKGYYKTEDVSTNTLLESKTGGTICGEGSAMFILSNNPEHALAKLNDVSMIVSDKKEDILLLFEETFQRNNIRYKDIDLFMTGMNGDVYNDIYYSEITEQLFPDSGHYVFKHITGDYPTVTSFALWFAAHHLNGANVPEIMIRKKCNRKPRNILIYNQYYNIHHGLIYISRI